MSVRRVLPIPRSMRRRLERTVCGSGDAKHVVRILIVLRYSEGLRIREIGKLIGRVPATVARVVQRFRVDGEDGLHDGRADNGVSKVDADALQALAEIVGASPQDFGWRRPTWTQELLVKTLAAVLQLEVSLTTVRRMLRHLGARWGSARPIVGCPWSRHRKGRRMRQIRDVIASLGKRDVAYYEDEVDIHLNPKIGRDWMLRGQQKEIMTPGQNRKRYLAGALSVDGSSFVTVAAERKTTNLFLALLDVLRRRHRDAHGIHLILDNYSIHSSRQAVKYLEDAGGLIVLHFLPPYSPQENRIERLWQDLHANVTRNHRCGTIDALMVEVTWWLAREKRRRRNHNPRTALSARRRAA